MSTQTKPKTHKTFLGLLLAIALPISLQSLIQSSLSMIDQMMIGQYGETAIAAVGIASSIGFFLIVTVGGIASGAGIYLAQFWGSKDLSKMGQTLGTTLLLGGTVSLVVGLLSFAFPAQAMGIFTKDAKVIETGIVFLQWMAPSYLPMLIVMVYAGILRTTGHARIPLYTGVFSVLCNTGLNYLFIFGNFGFPELGVQGAAMATLTTRCLEALLLLGIVYGNQFPGAFHLKELLRLDGAFVRVFLKTTYPVMLSEFLWIFGNMFYSVIYGRMGTDEIAAMTLTYPVQGLTVGLLTGMSSAAAIVIGNHLGAGEFDIAYKRSKIFLGLSGLAGLLIGGLFFLFSGLYISAYKVSAQVAENTWYLLLIFVIYLAVKVSNMVVGSGILRSGGETRYTLFLDVLGTWGLGLPIGFLAAFVFHMNILWVYGLINLEELVRLALGIRRLYSKKWMRQI